MSSPNPIKGAPITTRVREVVVDYRKGGINAPSQIQMNAITLGALASEWGIIDGIEENGNLILGMRIEVRPNIPSGEIRVL